MLPEEELNKLVEFINSGKDKKDFIDTYLPTLTDEQLMY